MAEFGWNGATGAGSTSCENVIVGGVYTPSSSGKVDSISAYLDFGGGSGTFTIKCALYQYNGGTTPPLLANGTTEERSFTNPWTDGYQTFNYTGTKPDIVSGVEYIICVWSNSLSAALNTRLKTAETGNRYVLDSQTYGAWPDPIVPVVNTADTRVNIYATYTPTGSRLLALMGVGT